MAFNRQCFVPRDGRLFVTCFRDLWTFAVLLCFVVTPVTVNTSQVEQSLYSRLVLGPRSNHRNVRPVKNHLQPVEVRLRVSLVDVLHLDDDIGHVTVKMWIVLKWRDEYLTWNPAQHDGVRRLNMQTGHDSKIWTPDIALFNALGSNESPIDTDAVVTSDGHVTWVTPVVYKVSAQHEFRTNSWTATFRFGSWSYDAGRLALRPDTGLPLMTRKSAAAVAAHLVSNEILNLDQQSPEMRDNSGVAKADAAVNGVQPAIRMDVESFVQTDQWAVLDTRGRLETTTYQCCPGESYTVISYSLKLRKKSGPSLLGRRGV